MPFFSYTAKSLDGKVVKGRVEAGDQDEALDKIRELGLWTLQLAEHPADVEYIGIGQWLSENLIQPVYTGVSAGAKLVFFTQMATMIRAGISMAEAMRQLAGQTRSGTLRRIALDAVERISQGESLSSCLARHGRAFRRDELEIIRAGELSGTIDESLANLASYLEDEVRLKRETAAAACYPVVLCGCALVLVGVIGSAGMIAKLLTGGGADTAKLLWAIFGRLITILIAVIVTIIVLRLALTNGHVRYVYDSIKIRIPIVGPLVRRYTMARFGRVFGALYRAGVPISQNLEASAACVPNYAVGARLGEAVATVKEGEPVSDALARTREVPDLVLAMLRTGERTGNIDETLGKMVEYYESDIKTATRLLLIVMFVLLLVGVAACIAVYVIKFWTGYFSGLFKMFED
jgi:type II secretory pathway component PulF